MANEAMSFLGAIGVGEESTYGTQASVTDWLQAVSESMNYQQNEDISSAIFGNSTVVDTVPGRIVAGGGLQIPFYGSSGMGRLLKWSSRQSSNAAAFIATVPTVSVQAGGSLDIGSYSVAYCHVYMWGPTGEYFVGSPSASVSATTYAGEQSIQVSYSLPDASTIPYGFAHAGVLVFRTAANGSNLFASVLQPGAGTSTIDDGSKALSSFALPSAIYKNQLQSNHAQPKSFTMECVDNNGYSRVFTGCMVNQLQISVKPGERIQTTFDLKAQTMISTASSTPAVTAVNGFHGKDTFVFIADQSGAYTQENLCNAFDLTLGNALDARPALNGHAYDRVMRAKRREVKGSADFDFESLQQQTDMIDKQSKDISLFCFGPGSSSGKFVAGSVTVKAMPYMMRVHIPNFVFESSAANLNADNPIVDKLPFVARLDPTAGYELAIELFNTASSL